MWLSYGVRLAWVVHPDTRTVAVHRRHADVTTLARNDTLTGHDALAGFTGQATEIFNA